MFWKADKYRIGIAGFLILATLTVATGSSVYVVMQHQAQSILSKSLEAALKGNVDLFEGQIAREMGNAAMIASRPFVIDSEIQVNAGNIKGKENLQRIAESFIAYGFDGVSFLDARGNEVAKAGRFSRNPRLNIPIDTRHSTFLLWNGQFILQTSTGIFDPQGRSIGVVKTETDLRLLASTFNRLTSIGKTSELALCGRVEGNPKEMDCFLSRISGSKFQRLQRRVGDKALPMNYALEGSAGLIFARDYRGQMVAAAYAPVGKRGIGMVLKIDQKELYGPVTEQLKYIALLLVALVILGGLLLHWMVTPLVRQLLASKHALQQENEKNMALLRSASDGIHILDTEGNIIEVSDSFCEMLGYRREEMIGMNVSRWDAGLLGKELAASLGRQFAQHERSLFETRHRRKDGSVFDVEISGLSLQLEGRSVLFNSARDITERKEKDDQLRQSKRRLEELLENMSSGVAVYRATPDGADFVFVNINRSSERMDQVRREDLIGKTLMEVYPGSEEMGLLGAFRRVWQSGKAEHFPVSLYRDERIAGWRENYIYRLESGEIIAIYDDVTERMQLQEALRHERDFMDAIFQSAGTLILALDREGNIVRFNRAAEEFTGYRFAEVKNKPFFWKNFLLPEQRGDVEAVFNLALSGTIKTRYENVWVARNGEERIFDWSNTLLLDDKGEMRFLITVGIDITERKRADDYLRLISSVFHYADEGIVITDRKASILEVNPAFSRITGYDREEALGKNPRILHSDRHDQAFYETLWGELLEKGHWSGEIWNKRKNGEVYPERLTLSVVKNEEGETLRYIGLFSDITHIKTHQQQLERMAHHDALTGLPNRMLLNDRLDMALAQAKRGGEKLAVCFMDLDGFKPVNDTFGHKAGDILLVEVAKRLLAISRATDTVARLGGDEFVLIFQDISGEAECGQMLSRIMEVIGQPFHIDGHDIRVSASIGVALYPDDTDGDSLLRHADQAMYVAKQTGRGRFHFFDASTD